MGLAVMQGELASSMGYENAQVLEKKLDNWNEDDATEAPKDVPSDGPALEWFQLAREVRDCAKTATHGTYIEFSTARKGSGSGSRE